MLILKQVRVMLVKLPELELLAFVLVIEELLEVQLQLEFHLLFLKTLAAALQEPI